MTRSSSPFSWHPEPELIGLRDPARSRPALERLGAEAWAACLDYLYDEAMRRPVGPDSYPELRRRLFPGGGPEEAPPKPQPSADVLAEFRRIAPFQFPCFAEYFTLPLRHNEHGCHSKRVWRFQVAREILEHCCLCGIDAVAGKKAMVYLR